MKDLERQVAYQDTWRQYGRLLRYGLHITAVLLPILLVLFVFIVYRLLCILTRPKPLSKKRSQRSRKAAQESHSDGNGRLNDNSSVRGAHLLVVLGSGGHTAEMLSILSTLGTGLLERFERRTYVVSSGDSFSAEKAKSFEKMLRNKAATKVQQKDVHNDLNDKEREVPNGFVQGSYTPGMEDLQLYYGSYAIATVHRARKIYQPLYTTPFSALWCVWDCIKVLEGRQEDLVSELSQSPYKYGHPDLILTNGPGTGVCVVVAALILQVFSSARSDNRIKAEGDMRTMYIESWARVKTLSLSGRILKYLVDRFLVQWERLVRIEDGGSGRKETSITKRFGKVEYVGPLVS